MTPAKNGPPVGSRGCMGTETENERIGQSLQNYILIGREREKKYGAY